MDFKKILRLITPIVVEGVLAVRKGSHDRLVEMLHDLDFVTRSVSEISNNIVVELQILDPNSFYRLLAGEANRFLLASRVSHARATQSQENNASWQAVEHYYSAYYAVHYLMRLTGVSLTNLDDRSISVIERSGLGLKAQTKLPTGLYVMHYDDTSKMLTLRKDKKKTSGGSHKDTWKLWEDLIETLKSRTLEDPVEYASVAVDLATHQSFLVKSSAKYNPPDIRGEINYQFKGGSWVFEPKAKDSIDRIQRSIESDQITQPVRIPNPEQLVASNKMIIGLAKAIFKNAAERYPGSICRSLANKYSRYVA